LTRDAIAQIYSITKPVTGVRRMQLWEQGKFELDEPSSRYLPEFETTHVDTGEDGPPYRAANRLAAVSFVQTTPF
jgi:CubicO group peptidase (beta-lactamase class C family)